jgi:hypothetical protein
MTSPSRLVLSRQRDVEGNADCSASFSPMLTLSPEQPSNEAHKPRVAALVARVTDQDARGEVSLLWIM